MKRVCENCNYWTGRYDYVGTCTRFPKWIETRREHTCGDFFADSFTEEKYGKTLRVYVVSVTDKKSKGCRISQDGYNTFEKAREFIRDRSDNPTKVDDFCYKSAFYEYNICICDVRLA